MTAAKQLPQRNCNYHSDQIPTAQRLHRARTTWRR